MVAIWLATWLTFAPHPFHESLAQAQWNEEGTRVQIALRMSPRDLDDALSATTGRRIVLEKSDAKETRELLTQYVGQRLFLSSSREAAAGNTELQRKARLKQFNWVGLEQEVRHTWIYFELNVPPRASRLWLTNRIGFEVARSQINTFQLVKVQPVVSVQTTQETPIKTLEKLLESRPSKTPASTTQP